MVGLLGLCLLKAVGLAADGEIACAADAEGFCNSRVVRHSLRYDTPDPVVRVNLALGKSLVVEFASPGMDLANDAVVGDVQLLKSSHEDKRIIIWVGVPETSGLVTAAGLVDRRTNVQLDFLGHLHLLVEVRVTEADDAGVERLVLDFPDRERDLDHLRTLVRQEESAREAKLDARERKIEETVRARARAQVSLGILQRLQCQAQRARSFEDLLLVYATRMCRLGDEVHIEFAIRNRSRSLFALRDVEVHAVHGETLSKIDDVDCHYDQDQTLLPYGAELRGIINVPADDQDAKEYALVVHESGGQARRMVLKGLRF